MAFQVINTPPAISDSTFASEMQVIVGQLRTLSSQLNTSALVSDGVETITASWTFSSTVVFTGAPDFSGATNKATIRTDLGLGTLATQAEGTGGADFRDNAANDGRFAQRANNLSDLTNAGTARSNLQLGSLATQAEGTGSSQFRDNAANDARFVQRTGDSMTGALNMGGSGIINAAYISFDGSGTTGDYVNWNTGSGFHGYENGDFRFRIGSVNTVSTNIPSVFQNTTASGANVHSNSGGGVLRSTSTGVNKTNRAAVDGEIVMALNPVSFESTHLHDWNRRFAGFIAEEVEAVFPEASVDDGQNYDVRAIAAVLVAKVQAQQMQIDALLARVAALEAA